MKLVYLSLAYQDLENITLYIANDNPVSALQLIDRIEQSLIILKHHPFVGRETQFEGLYRWVIPNTSYSAFYRIESDTIIIARILHNARQFPDALNH